MPGVKDMDLDDLRTELQNWLEQHKHVLGVHLHNLLGPMQPTVDGCVICRRARAIELRRVALEELCSEWKKFYSVRIGLGDSVEDAKRNADAATLVYLKGAGVLPLPPYEGDAS